MESTFSDISILMRGRHQHYARNGAWTTVLANGEVADGFVPDPDYVEPKVTIDGRRAPEGVKRELFHFKVMHCGWECDEDGWVVEMEDGTRALVLMSHMSLYIAGTDELHEKLAEYERVVADTQKALTMVSDSDGTRSAETAGLRSLRTAKRGPRSGIAQTLRPQDYSDWRR